VSGSGLTAGSCALLACVFEVQARKPGNVSSVCDFEDVTYADFVRSADAIAPVIDSALQGDFRVGQIVLECVKATRKVTSTNTNLGILLLLAPLVKAGDGNLRSGVERVLQMLTIDDARAVCEAIRLACPGGMGEVAEQDIHQEPTVSLRQVMALAAARDLVALQYVNGFAEVFAEGLPALQQGIERLRSIEGGIISCHLQLLARHRDSLIERKLGQREAAEASRRAAHVLDTGWPERPEGRAALKDYDVWLRGCGHQRNPGTTADLVTACLFVLLREGRLKLPLEIPFAAEDPYG
jgi:triphosphoribosyl-dephospho-CoA synthase